MNQWYFLTFDLILSSLILSKALIKHSRTLCCSFHIHSIIHKVQKLIAIICLVFIYKSLIARTHLDVLSTYYNYNPWINHDTKSGYFSSHIHVIIVTLYPYKAPRLSPRLKVLTEELLERKKALIKGWNYGKPFLVVYTLMDFFYNASLRAVSTSVTSFSLTLADADHVYGSVFHF